MCVCLLVHTSYGVTKDAMFHVVLTGHFSMFNWLYLQLQQCQRYEICHNSMMQTNTYSRAFIPYDIFSEVKISKGTIVYIHKLFSCLHYIWSYF